MNKNGVLGGKKILLVSQDEQVHQRVKQGLLPHKAVFFYTTCAKDAVGLTATKSPDLILYDDRMPSLQGTPVLALIKRLQPKGRILLLSRVGVPLRSIDVSAQGVSFTIPVSSTVEQIYNAVKHCLGIASVPRVEQMAS